MISPTDYVIGDDYVPPEIMGDGFARGLIPRDFAAFPVGSFAPPADIPLIPWRDMPDLIRASEANKSRLSDLVAISGPGGGPIPNIDQNEPNSRPPRWGYCWAHSTAHAVQAIRAVNNQGYLPISAFGLAYTVKGGKDEGAWSALSLDFAIKHGFPLESGPQAWPRFERRARPMNHLCWSMDAANLKVTGGFVELQAPVYDRDLSWQQVLSCLLMRVPIAGDWNWWGHAVAGLDAVDVYPNRSATDPSRYGIRIWNSWGEGWGDRGFGVLKDSRAIPDNAVAPRSVTLWDASGRALNSTPVIPT